MKAIIVIVVLIVIGGWVWSARAERKKCEDMALSAAVEEITPANNPYAESRGLQQQQYQDRYVQACLDLH